MRTVLLNGTIWARLSVLAVFARVGEMVGVAVSDHDQADVLRIDLQTREHFLVFSWRGLVRQCRRESCLILDQDGIWRIPSGMVVIRFMEKTSLLRYSDRFRNFGLRGVAAGIAPPARE